MFNKDELSKLILTAKGDRSINQFARDAGVDSGHLSRVINKKIKAAPKAPYLKQLAIAAHNNITYESLLDASGHLTNLSEDEKYYIKQTDYAILKKKEKIANSIIETLIENKVITNENELTEKKSEWVIDILKQAIRLTKS